MAGVSVISGSASGFGSVAGIRRQWKRIQARVGAESAARRAEEERTGLIQNPDTGEMVQISSISEEKRERWEHRHEINSISPQEAMIGFMATDPHAEEVEENKRLAAIAAKLQDKMLAGKKLKGEEKKFLREHYPEMAALAERMEQEAAQLEQRLRGCKSREEAQQAYMEAKMRIMSRANKKDDSIRFLNAAIDEAYSRHLKRGASSEKQVDILA